MLRDLYYFKLFHDKKHISLFHIYMYKLWENKPRSQTYVKNVRHFKLIKNMIFSGIRDPLWEKKQTLWTLNILQESFVLMCFTQYTVYIYIYIFELAEDTLCAYIYSGVCECVGVCIYVCILCLTSIVNQRIVYMLSF